ncbi:TPA: hypothetical protein ACH3X2_000858 [Trebouxia sp. C0005]
MPVHVISCPFLKYQTWHMQISFDVGATWLTFAGGLLFGTCAAAAVAYVLLRNQIANSEPIRSKVKASRSYSPRRVRARRGDAYEHETVPGSPHSRSSAHKNGQSHQHKLDSALSLDVADPTVSPRRAAAVRDEVTEDEWGSTHRSDPLRIVKAGRYGEESSHPSKPAHAYKGSPDRSNHGAREYANDHFKQANGPAVATPPPYVPVSTFHGPHPIPAYAHQAPPPAPPPAHTLSTAVDLMNTGKIIEDAAMHDQYCRVITPEPAINEETEEVCTLLKQCYALRDKWLFTARVSPAEQHPGMPEVAAPSLINGDPFKWEPQPVAPYDFEMQDGVFRVYDNAAHTSEPFPVPGNSFDFFSDMSRMCKIAAMGPIKSFCHHRLMLLEQKFNLHVMLNADKEFLAQKTAPHRDFYNVRKVDTHVHHSACMHQKHLLRFIKSKLRKEPGEVVIFRDGKYLTLQEVFESLKLTGYDLNVDTLDMHAGKESFHRFDRFNLKYNPFGQSRLREIFIKQDNILHGRYLAELTKEVLIDLEASKYQHAEYRISIYGRKYVEWDILAAWYCQNKLYSDNVLWLIQLPRLYNVYKEQGIIENFEQLLDNIFQPLFEVTKDPNSHPQLHLFLKNVVGLDMVDDESKPERRPAKHMQTPAEWNLKHNPAYSYYAYYVYANLFTLNKLREARGLNTIAFRPHAGEAGDTDHLVSAFMLCENIAHGINLRKSPCMQYLYYMKQVGLCMSPLSNNSLFLDYHRNPFPTFFARGMNVSLSTDDPLQIHLTKEPLVEEYSVAAQVWKLSATDLCEVARNSVLHSGFPHQIKMHWVCKDYWKPGPDGNDIHKTNVPNLRMRFRYDCHSEELNLVMSGAAAHEARRHAKSRE